MTTPPPMEIDCATVKKRIDAGDDICFIDCREVIEHTISCIASARLLPMSELANRVSELEPFRQTEIIVHCHHGGRSLRVANWLRQNGFDQARSMAGGIDQWSLEIDPTVPRY